METYIALLRGINVSGKNLIKMDALREVCGNFGFTNVQTYIQSGNLVFLFKATDNSQLAKDIEDLILKEFMLQVTVLVLKKTELIGILENNPFLNDPSKDKSGLYITFLSEDSANQILSSDFAPEEYYISGRAVYLYCPLGYGNTKLNNNFFEKKLKLKASTRNLKTSIELLRMANEIR